MAASMLRALFIMLVASYTNALIVGTPLHRRKERLDTLEPEEISFFDDLVSLRKDALFKPELSRTGPEVLS